MNEYEATIQINPTDDIKFILEESGCYESEIEMMKAGGTYDAFVKRVYDAKFLSCSVPLRINFLISGKLIPMNNI